MGNMEAQSLYQQGREQKERGQIKEAIRFFRKAAGQGSPEAMYELGAYYIESNGLFHGKMEGISWLEKAAQLGNIPAAKELGDRYLQGNGVPESLEAAAQWYRCGAEAGDRESMLMVALCYRRGNSPIQNQDEARHWFRKAAELGDPDAMAEMGDYYSYRDEKEAIQWFHRSVEAGASEPMALLGDLYLKQGKKELAAWWYRRAEQNGDRKAGDRLASEHLEEMGLGEEEPLGEKDPRYQKGTVFLEAGRYEEAFRAFYDAAQEGNAEAMIPLANLCGREVVPGHSEAERTDWLTRAAEEGSLYAMQELGFDYEYGVYTAQDEEKALYWYLRGAETGDAATMGRLGNYYSRHGNKEEAFRWTQKAAEAGNAFSMWLLSTMYEKGNGVEKDPGEAAKWLRKSAEAGEKDGMIPLGDAYRDGKGVEKDLHEAAKWYQKAAEAGNLLGYIELAGLYQSKNSELYNEKTALHWYLTAADAGESFAYYMLGQHCLDGGEDDQALDWFRKGADAEEPHSAFALALLYEEGKIVAQDQTLAEQWLHKAAEFGSDEAEELLTVSPEERLFRCAEELMFEDEYELALNLLHQAARAGDLNAMNTLGSCYYNGTGVSEDPTAGLNWYRKSAEQGNTEAMVFLGDHSINEGKEEEAMSWYRKAARLGDSEAEERLETYGWDLNAAAGERPTTALPAAPAMSYTTRAYAGDEPYIFISYSHREKDQVLPVIERMQADGYRVWFDEGIDPGTEWDNNIAEHLDHCAFLIAFISEHYLGSDNCKDELNFARDLGLPVLLIYLSPVELPRGMALRLGRKQAIHSYTYEDREEFIRKLYTAPGLDVAKE